jgi:hypothetical protein
MNDIGAMLPVEGPRGIGGRSPLFDALLLALAAVALGVLTAVALSSGQLVFLIPAALFPFAAAAAHRFRQVLLATIALDIAFGIDIHLGFRSDMAVLGSLSGYPVSASTGCLALLYIFWLGEFACRKGARAAPRMRESLPLFIYATCVALSMIVATDVMLSGFQVVLYAQMLLLYIYVASTVRTRAEIAMIVIVLLVSLILEGTLMMYVRLTGQHITFGPISTSMDASYEDLGRLAGTLGSPNATGGFAAMLTLLAGSLFFARSDTFPKALTAIAFGAGGLALLLTKSRGGWTAFGVSLLILWFLTWKKGWLPSRGSLWVIILTVLASALLHQSILNRLMSDDGGAAFSRVPLMDLAFEMIREKPLLGVGANNFAMVMDDYITAETRDQWLYTVHNKYLLVWSETGFLGLSAFLWFLGSALRSAWRSSKSRDMLIAPLALGLMAAVLANIAHMLVDVFNDRPLAQLLCLMAGLIAALDRVEKA